MIDGRQKNIVEPPIRVLLWSAKGSGLHYGGPGMSAYRMYSKAIPGTFNLTLAHGYNNQDQYPIFESIVKISCAGPNPFAMSRFASLGKRWVAAHAKEFDIFHGLQGFDLTLVPAMAAQRAGLPAVVKLAAYHSDLADKSGIRHMLFRPAARRRRWIAELDAVVAISDAIADELLSYGVPESRIARIPNGVDTDQFYPAADRADASRIRTSLGWPDRPTLLFVGGINKRKRPHLLVDVIARATALGDGPNRDCQLVLIGPADDLIYMDFIRSHARDLGVLERLIIEPFREDIASAYRAADVFGLLSQNEGMPNALLEAMASGLPSIVTNISGSKDLVQDGYTGRVIGVFEKPLSNVNYAIDLAAEALVEALSSAGNCFGMRAAQYVRDHYSATTIARMHYDLFRSIMTGR